MHADLICTYRLQLKKSFGLNEAKGVVEYLSRLGISHLYLSPILQASPGSEHGYDATDPTKISEELGGEASLIELFDEVRARKMGVVIDIVPNHLAAIPHNPWWRDVLEKGPDSPHAAAFDVRWLDPEPGRNGKVLLPILADHLGKVLDRREITVSSDGQEFVYFDHRFPINSDGQEMLERNGDDLGAVLDKQFYRLAHWRTATTEINYRRFFDVTTLVGVRVEDPVVFHATHSKLLEVMEKGPVDGFRIDHPDGLRDPAGYFHNLVTSCGDRWLVAEKILEPGEPLVAEWPVDGTTGYDFLQRAGGLFVDPEGEKTISDFYSEFTGHSDPYGALVRQKKRNVIALLFEGDVRYLTGLLRGILMAPPIRRDDSHQAVQDLLTEVIAAFPVYRTYLNSITGAISVQDRTAIREALAPTRRQDGPFDPELIDLLENILTGNHHPDPAAVDFVARFQQITGPVMAKGVEDTTFYCYDRLIALNDVGCDPARFGVSPQSFHEASITSQRDWPQSMLASSTHDTKRSEDVRARISLLSEMGHEWSEHVRAWSIHNQPAWQGRTPDRNAEHLFYQTLVGAWPITTERMLAYMAKACREAKQFTSWIRPDESYESMIQDFVRGVLNDEDFTEKLKEFIDPLVAPGRLNSLALTLLKLTAPGIPDIYQGCELWDHSLVDPDNRRPVDYEARLSLLAELENGLSVDEVMARADEGLPKLYLIREALRFRRELPEAFGGDYQPLLVTGSKLRHLIAYCRGGKVAVAVPRLVHGLAGSWEDTQVELGADSWRNLFDGKFHSGAVPVADLFRNFPVALLKLELT